jgi:type I restriction enzyme S subunit
MNNAIDHSAIESLLDGCWPGEWGQEPTPGNGNAIVYRSTDIDDSGHLNEEGGAERIIETAKLNSKVLQDGDILLEASGGTPDRPVGRVALYQEQRREPCVVSNFLRTLRPKKSVNSKYLLRQLLQLQQSTSIWRYQQQTTGIINLKFADYLKHKIWVPDRDIQDEIALIGESLDTAIEKTESLIAKYQKIKAGLMHDLFTRGVTVDGKLRPPREHAPELYHETPIGWIPKEWRVQQLQELVRNDSPITYGVVQPGPEDDQGVLFIRGGDIFDGEILIENLRTISHSVSINYRRTLLQGGELVISLVGYPGQVAVVPPELAGANIARQAALVRLRDGISPAFVTNYLLSDLGKNELFRNAVGSAQQVINLADLKFARVALPNMEEQINGVEAISELRGLLSTEIAELRKLKAQKAGLMHDLLTGKVYVSANSKSPEIAGG